MKNLQLTSVIGLMALLVGWSPLVMAQSKENPVDKFRQLEEILPTPNAERIASGAPGRVTGNNEPITKCPLPWTTRNSDWWEVRR